MAVSLLDIVKRCANDEPWTDASVCRFTVDGFRVGFVPNDVCDAVADFAKNDTRGAAFEIGSDSGPRAMTFAATCASREARTEAMDHLTQWLRESGRFPDPLDGWRDEAYAVYGRGAKGESHAVVLFTVERAACALFGFATFGVHLTAYAPDGRIWVPRRSATKQTYVSPHGATDDRWPGYLDNSVAGGITAGDAPLETIVRECGEEAGLDATLVRRHIKQTGLVSYFYKTSRGWRQPEMQFTYDLALPSSDVQLYPGDGEAESFELCEPASIMRRMRDGEFKPNCALVLIDFFIRHGMVTSESERDYSEIVALTHTPLGLPCP